MSDTENGNKGLPPQDEFICDTEGLTAWAAVFDRIIIRDELGGRKQIKISRRDEVVFVAVISREQAEHLRVLLARNGEAA